MKDCARKGLHDLDLASRKSEEAALRRSQAAGWLESLVGPLGISKQPSERDFIYCLRNGLILCNALNKIEPGSISKVVDNNQPSQSLTREIQPLPAYQYFENVRNFLVAVGELKLPAFEASDLERDTIEAGSVAKVVDCILSLKSYHEWKHSGGGNGFYKHMRSPMVPQPVSRINLKTLAANPPFSVRRLDMSTACENQSLRDGGTQKLEDLVDSTVKSLADCMVDTKENVDQNLLASFRDGNLDPVKLFSKFMSRCLEEQLLSKFSELELRSGSLDCSMSTPSENLPDHSTPLESLPVLGNTERCKVCLSKDKCNHRLLFQMQEKELLDLKALLSSTKREFEDLQFQLQGDLKALGTQVEELSSAALGYHKVVKENRTLFNMVQDLKGNIRVYCRVRPTFIAEPNNIVDFIGDDGSLVILDPQKPQKDGRKVFQFDWVFGPTATQDEVFRDTQPLIRSVMDGYNVCIFAYGQTGSGKTHTMSGPSCGPSKDVGINYLALEDLFQMSNRRKDITTYEIYVQMVEIYNEQVRDLLAEDSSATRLEIRSCTGENGSSLPDATIHRVTSTNAVLNLMKLGQMNRVVSSTAVNNHSSRSHSILIVHVHGKDMSGSIFRSCLHLVDLAGSERVDKSEVTGDRLKEAQYINKSLSCLGDVIAALAQKSSHIPYRNSKLTLLLQDSLGGNAKTLMFAHVSPEGDSFGETVSTLKFAQRVSNVELGVARSNKQSSEVMQLKEQIDSLKKALANKESQNVQLNRTREAKSPCRTPRVGTEQTPSRIRRLSIENSSIIRSNKSVHVENRKGSKTPVPTRSRRLSSEGSQFVKDTIVKENVYDSGSLLLPLEAVPGAGEVAEAVPKLSGSNRAKSPNSAYQKREMKTESRTQIPRLQRPKTPDPLTVINEVKIVMLPGSDTAKSPNSAYQKRAVKTESRTQIPPLQRPKTPEPLTVRKGVQMVTQTELTLPESQTWISNMTSGSGSGSNRKASHIRKSLRTIGKLINGSERRNPQTMMEISSPIVCTSSNINSGLSPLPATTSRALRRQSLTGGQTSSSERSRRSSLGGKLVDNASKQ